MRALWALVVVLALGALGAGGGSIDGLRPLFGVVVPYVAFVVFLVGAIGRVLGWARSPVPFRIPTTCGQQRSLSWIRPSRLDNPSTTLGVVGRMALEVLFFRSLARNTRTERQNGSRLTHGGDRRLWIAALAFHWSLLLVVARHLRLFLEPVPAVVGALARLDAFFQLGVPGLYASDVIVTASLAYLVLRRLAHPQVRYISLFADYLALFLIGAVAASGILMRYVIRTDVVAAKQLALGLVTFAPVIPEGVSALFLTHVFLVSVLGAYVPWSKLAHAGGVFLSPTRNLANTSRMERHVNPWNPSVRVHTYEKWEDEFREKIRAAGLPLEKG